MGSSGRRKRERHANWRWYAASGFCFLFFFVALSSFVADIAAFRAVAWVEAWTNLVAISAAKGQAYRPADADWNEAHTDALLAVRLAPFNANYHETLARVYIARQLDLGDGDPRLRPLLRLAAAEYQTSIRLRPTWPYGHLGHAYVLRRELQLDDEYEQSLGAALKYGPWEPEVLAAVVDINIGILPTLQPTTRELVLDALRRGQAWTEDSQGNPVPYGNQIWRKVVARHREMVACGWLRIDTPLLKQRCQPQAPSAGG
ncbi:MAG: hypothetical protein ACRERR_05290 [Moraxellaceae bacterium]